jgi:hypothetical protein
MMACHKNTLATIAVLFSRIKVCHNSAKKHKREN